MNLKKNWKRFWTLSSAREGFTLVELIVVIAILAILAGVAVPAYSGYVTKANKQADITLASEIEHTLTLAHYSGTLNPGASVIVYYGEGASFDVNCSDESAEAAMVAAFGANYKETLRLKYDGWTGTAATIDIDQINASNFGEENLDTMMADVSTLSGVLANYLGAGATYKPLQDYMSANNITTDDPQVLANLAVLQVADSLNGVNSEIFVEDYQAYDPSELAKRLQVDNGANLDKLTAYAVAYAQMEGLLNYIEANATTDADKAAIAQIRGNWTTETGKLSDVTSIDALLVATEDSLYGQLEGYVLSYFDEDTGAYADDAAAFLSYMTGVNEVAPTISSDLNALANADYYKGDTVTKLINNYISAASGLDGYAGSAVIVLYDGTTVCSYPFDFTNK